jgi:hypothetical protein
VASASAGPAEFGPRAAAQDIERAIAQGGKIATLIALLAPTGLPLSEALSLNAGGKFATSENYYDESRALIHIEKSTSLNSRRDVYLTAAFNDWFKGQANLPYLMSFKSVYADYLMEARVGIEPPTGSNPLDLKDFPPPESFRIVRIACLLLESPSQKSEKSLFQNLLRGKIMSEKYGFANPMASM